MTGRPRTISAQVREAIAAAGVDGLTPEELRERIPGMGHRQGKHSVDRLVEAGEIFRLGNYRRTKFFAPSVTMEEAKASMARFMAQVAVHAKTLAAAAHQRRLAKERERRAERAAAMAEVNKAKVEARILAAAERERPRQQARNANARAQTAAKRHREANGLADRIRGTAAPKERARPAPVITKAAGFKHTVAEPKRDYRFQAAPDFKGPLKSIGPNQYETPASTWAQAVQRRAA